ncbi:MAG TPA: hypothetical protein VLQ91_21385 [Draconibacterium sp.]|nr:hypothetical protein [Draconibacterium sp.]
MKNYFFTLIFILALAGFSFGQASLNYEIQETIDFYKANKFISGETKNVLTENNITGSPYLNKDFETGTIFTVQRRQYVGIPLRYNIYNDNLEFKNPADEIQALATPEIVEKAVIVNTQLIYLPYLQANKTKKGFFIVLEEGKASVYSKPGILFKERTEPGAYKEPEPPKFVRKSEEYYIRIGNEQAILIKSKKELIAAFPDNQDKIENFISKNKIKTNKPEGLKEVVIYYNSL